MKAEITQEELATVVEALKKVILDRAMSEAIRDDANGVLPSAKEDIQNRARSVWHVEDDGSLTPKCGNAVLFGPDSLE